MNISIATQVSQKKLDKGINAYFEFNLKYGRAYARSTSSDESSKNAYAHLAYRYTTKEFLARHDLKDLAKFACITVLLINPERVLIHGTWTVIYEDIYLSPCNF